ACKQGFTLIYDEFTRSRPEANNILLSVLEERTLDLPAGRGQDTLLKVHPQFTALFTSNPTEYAGVHKAQDALWDRMITIKLGAFDQETEVEIVRAKSGIAKDDAERIVGLVRDFHGDGRSNGQVASARAGIMIAKILVTYDARAQASDDNFVRTCVDVLDSSKDWQSNGAAAKKVKSLVKKWAS
ncbi:unnamed protein product, partial [marine sediment metagenome]